MRQVIASLILLASSTSFAVGFAHGNEFRSIPVYGEVFVDCHEGSSYSTAVFQCQDLILSPAEMDYFVGPAVDADSVTLTATRRDGSTKTKSSSYSVEKGRSTSRFNLWIATLFQSPLIMEGKNLVRYEMTKSGQVVAEGNVDVNVSRGPAANCPRGTLMSSSMADCQSPYSACQRYFSQYNYCQ